MKKYTEVKQTSFNPKFPAQTRKRVFTCVYEEEPGDDQSSVLQKKGTSIEGFGGSAMNAFNQQSSGTSRQNSSKYHY